MHEAGTKIIMVTHNLGQARSVSATRFFSASGSPRGTLACRDVFPATPFRHGGRAIPRRRITMVVARRLFLAALLAAAALCCARAGSSSPSHRPRRPNNRACLAICYPIYEQQTGSRCVWWRLVRVRRSMSVDAATPMSCSCMRGRRKTNFSPKAEGVKRYPVMYNDFVLIGPKSDPAHVGGGKDILPAMKKLGERRRHLSCRGATAAVRTWRTRPVEGCRHRHR